jgi:hypothetical protein
MNFMRVWMSGAGINGSQWLDWASHHLPSDGYLPGVYFDLKNTYQSADVAMKLDSNNPCFFAGFWQGGIPVEPGAVYRVTARVKLNGVTGQGSYGFVIKRGGWLEEQCAGAGQGTLITEPVTGSTGWITVSGTYTTAQDQNWLGNLYLALQNVTGGEAYVHEVHLWKDKDPWQVELLHDPYANSHLYFDPMNAAKWDRYIEAAERHGVYLKLVIDEKNEWIRNHIDAATGKMTADGDNNYFYAAPGTKVRWLQEAWWRYLIARWGYSTAIHSFEYINEGDPYNGYHHDAADAMARYFDEHDPGRHMVTTSFWASFPNAEFWSNPGYTSVDYADLHAYISTGWGTEASFLGPAYLETRPQFIHSGNASAHINGADDMGETISPRGLVLREPGEWFIRYWMKAENLTTDCPYDTTGSMVFIRWSVDGGSYEGGFQGIVPGNSEGKDFICTSPAGTFNWTQFRSDLDRNGDKLPAEHRLIIDDNLPHELSLTIINTNGDSGQAWIDNVELVSPSGRVVPVIGQFDITPLDEDTAWFNRAYGELWGGRSPVGARMPLVRGETGIDFPDRQEWNPELNKDTQGIWLHNNVWGQINPGGMYELFWWVSETIPETLYPHYLTYRNFMAGIPLSNGHYQDAAAATSQPDLRAWGQRDDVNGRMHLWIQNIQHTWKRVVSGSSIPPLSGTVTLSHVPAGTYQVTWWDTYRVEQPIIRTEQITSAGGTLQLTLPQPLASDIAVKLERMR